MNTLTFVTSNIRKLREFQKFIPELSSSKGIDLPEVDGTMDEVAIYKALMAGDGHMVEDTILIVDGEEVVDIRWKIDYLEDGSEVVWITTIATNLDGRISLYRGSLKGVIDTSRYTTDDAFGFDSIFLPDGSDCTLYELGYNRVLDARKSAIESYLNDSPVKVVNVKDVLPWDGNWQNS